jgi:mannosyl-oligosaccharide glucosidase
MAITAYISQIRAESMGPTDQDLGMDYGMMANQDPLAPGSDEDVSKYLRHDEAMTLLKAVYKPLKRHYDWFRRTQRGQIKQYARKARSRTEAYRWRGRSQQHVLTSGMDDYPRGPPHAGELHLDLMAWMGFFTRTMKDIANFVGEIDDELSFAELETAILNNLEGIPSIPLSMQRYSLVIFTRFALERGESNVL